MEKKLELILEKLGELNSIKDELTKLNGRVTNIESTMATEEDIAHLASKEDIANMVTQKDIANMATKQDIDNMLTKDDMAHLATKEEIADIPAIKVAVLKIKEIVKMIQEDQKSIFGILGEHEVSIRTLKRRSLGHN